jgi:hypothetical protein
MPKCKVVSQKERTLSLSVLILICFSLATKVPIHVIVGLIIASVIIFKTFLSVLVYFTVVMYYTAATPPEKCLQLKHSFFLK